MSTETSDRQSWPEAEVIPHRHAPGFLVSEMHGTLNWAVVTAVLWLIIFVNFLVLLCQWLVVADEASSASSQSAVLILAGAIAVTSIPLLISGWVTLRFLKYLSAIWRLRSDSPMEAGEEALGRQLRLWRAMAAAALCGVIGACITTPRGIAEAKAKAAKIQALQDSAEQYKEREEELRQSNESWTRQENERKARLKMLEDERKARLKKLEDDYWRSKRERGE